MQLIQKSDSLYKYLDDIIESCLFVKNLEIFTVKI